jgi:hypothetical protein
MLAASIRPTALALSDSSDAASTLASNFRKAARHRGEHGRMLDFELDTRVGRGGRPGPGRNDGLACLCLRFHHDRLCVLQVIRAERIRSMLEHTTVMTADIQGVPPGNLTARCVVLCWKCDRDLGPARAPADDSGSPPSPASVAEWRSTTKRLIPDRGLPEPGLRSRDGRARLTRAGKHLSSVRRAWPRADRGRRGRRVGPRN